MNKIVSVLELVSYDSQEVRASPDLLALYVQTFEQYLGYKPNCVGCTFNNDFEKLKSKINADYTNFQLNKIMKNNKKVPPLEEFREAKKPTFIYRQQNCEILWYRKDDHIYKCYDYCLTDDFVNAYLTHGTEQEIAERKKRFSKIPDWLNPKKPQQTKKL